MCLSSRQARPICLQSCVPSASSQVSAAAKVMPRACEEVRAESRSPPALRKMLTDVTEGKTQTETQHRAGFLQGDPPRLPQRGSGQLSTCTAYTRSVQRPPLNHLLLWAFVRFLVLNHFSKAELKHRLFLQVPINLSPIWCCIYAILWYLNGRLTSSGPSSCHSLSRRWR